MKQIPVTDQIRQRLIAASADPDKVAVFEAVALNTLPVRKQHPLYKDAVHAPSMLQSMADQLNKESLPLQAMHNGAMLPFGRAFYGEVLPSSDGHELRTLFWVDKAHSDLIDMIDSGTIDQVSVSVLAKQANCSECGYDFFAENASVEPIWTGTCPDGHTMGQKGAHLKLNELSSWFELSLVGRGGAQGARIAGPAETRLAANGEVIHPFALSLTSEAFIPETKPMSVDVNKLISDLSDSRGNLLVANAEKTRLEASVTERDARIATLTGELETVRAELAAAKDAKPEAGAAELDALKGVAKHLLTLAGRVTDEVPEKLEDIVELVKGLKLSIASNTQTMEAADTVAPRSASGFRSPR